MTDEQKLEYVLSRLRKIMHKRRFDYSPIPTSMAQYLDTHPGNRLQYAQAKLSVLVVTNTATKLASSPVYHISGPCGVAQILMWDDEYAYNGTINCLTVDHIYTLLENCETLKDFKTRCAAEMAVQAALEREDHR